MILRPVFSSIALALALAGCATRAPAPAPIELQLVALNDFHGHLEADKFTYTSVTGDKRSLASIQAGGFDTIAAALNAWRAEDKDLMLVAAGDLVGASPAMSSMWADEPSVVAMNMLGLRASSVGNHEFDQGRTELLRKQNGGCAPALADKSCKLAPDFSGAKYRYLAANVIDSATGKPFLPGYRIEQVKGVKVAFIGAVTKDTPSVVLASGIAGLTFTDEADAINKAQAEAKGQGATVFVVLIHEGGRTAELFDQPDCAALKGPIVDIARRLDPSIRLILSGHTHRGYLCKVDGRVITQAEMGGHVLSRIRMTIDPATHAVSDIGVRNVVMRPGAYPADPAAVAFLKSVKERSEAALARPVAHVATRSVGRKGSPAGESPLGDLIADSVLAATEAQGVQIAFMNNGGMRSDFDVGENLVATYGQAQVVLPFSNTLVVMDMTGAQVRGLLEQQWARADASADHTVLQVSRGFSYRWNEALPPGQRVIAGSIKLNGVPLDEQKTYRVAANNFLAEGGDNFPMFIEAKNKVNTQIRDLDAFTGFLVRNEKAGAPIGLAAPAARIEKVN